MVTAFRSPVKAGQVQECDRASLRAVARGLGDRFVAGVVLYRGQQVLSFAPKLTALPLQELWVGE
jgi:hypothetical protein